MTQTSNVARDDVAQALRDAAVIVGGVYAGRPAKDETVWRIARGLSRVFLRGQQRRHGLTPPTWDPPVMPHPAVSELLRILDADTPAKPPEPPPLPPPRDARVILTYVPGLFTAAEVVALLERGVPAYVRLRGRLDDIALFSVFGGESIPTNGVR